IGLVLMLLPTGNSRSGESGKAATTSSSTEPLSQQLETILSTIQGAGRVRVMLTIAAGEEVIYQTDNDHTTNDTSGTNRSSTVVISDSERNESGLVKNKNAPVYRGALVVCDGAQTPTVTFAVVDAVSKVTGLSTDKISVLKME
ncbi:MAG: hypothetical protein J6A74_06975, partial [Oscillospiraceae bacterium]|nr:hypothetical protein [Oscillospiraceae bacterium]